ncbi:plastocyanin/azurin family copper-binding protein [uncultured Fibrella sp.]|uniref:plastocyanin/azurin family copper-binding protein n=1 Tax=uncultured Fibrella sp. TaxID=1284596 RepID=UPI0035CB4C60
MRLLLPGFFLLLFLASQSARSQSTFSSAPDTIITIKAVEGLQFSEKRLVLKPRTRLMLIVQNDDDMAHNLVVTQPNTRARVVEFALAMGQSGPTKNFVPNLPDVVAHTHLLNPDERDTLRLRLAEEGDFSYVCTYPGHGSIMYGMLYVTGRPAKLPPIENDPNLPQAALTGNEHTHHAPAVHPYMLQLPAVYRTFMPDASPAAIAVGLPSLNGGPNQSYCWDATTCQLRYAWEGGFVDNSEQWEGKGQRLTKIIGNLYFRDSTFNSPWQIAGQKPAAIRFKGYELVNRYPEFSYSIDGITVRELTKPTPGKRGLTRRFMIGPSTKPLRFRLGDVANRYRASVGRIENGWLVLAPGTRLITLTVN